MRFTPLLVKPAERRAPKPIQQRIRLLTTSGANGPLTMTELTPEFAQETTSIPKPRTVRAALQPVPTRRFARIALRSTVRSPLTIGTTAKKPRLLHTVTQALRHSLARTMQLTKRQNLLQSSFSAQMLPQKKS
jgi:hypothetical protein